jgi:uncharacterized heparinase superfamily protein
MGESRASDSLLRSIGVHAGFVRRHLELDVGGNHLMKNLKALVGLGVFFDDDRLLQMAERHLTRQLEVQVLADGGHFERSPSYHCQVLADLLDISRLLTAAGKGTVAGLDGAISSMREWLGTICMPDGDVPLFNDSALVGKERLAKLAPTSSPGRLTILQPSGYVVMRPSHLIHLVADVGPPCPEELPAHAHADCLSFQMSVDGQRTLIDTGTSTYESGPRRDYERSTRAHNTVEVDRTDQTEVWASFRAGRRANPFLERAVDYPDRIEVTASHDGYRRLPGAPRHRRTWRVTDESVEIVDEVLGIGPHDVAARLHLCGPGIPALESSGLSTDVLRVWSSASRPPELCESEHALYFGRRVTGHTASWHERAHLPFCLRTTITLVHQQPPFGSRSIASDCEQEGNT